MSNKIQGLSNLRLTNQVITALQKDKPLDPKVKKEIIVALTALDSFGTDKEHFRAKLKSLKNGWWELRIKTWRVMFVKIDGTNEYGVVYIFEKKTDAISTKDWDNAKSLLKSEDW